MRMRRSSLFQGLLPIERHTSSSLPTEPEPTPLTPGQQLVLLRLRRSELAVAVVQKLSHSTVRSTPADHDVLLRLYLIMMYRDGKYRLTPHGHSRANQIARDLRREFNIDITPRQRGMYRAGERARFNFW